MYIKVHFKLFYIIFKVFGFGFSREMPTNCSVLAITNFWCWQFQFSQKSETNLSVFSRKFNFPESSRFAPNNYIFYKSQSNAGVVEPPRELL